NLVLRRVSCNFGYAERRLQGKQGELKEGKEPRKGGGSNGPCPAAAAAAAAAVAGERAEKELCERTNGVLLFLEKATHAKNRQCEKLRKTHAEPRVPSVPSLKLRDLTLIPRNQVEFERDMTDKSLADDDSDEIESIQDSNLSSRPGWRRYAVAWLSCLGLMLVLAMRSEIGIAIIQMTRKETERVPFFDSKRNDTEYRTEIVQEIRMEERDEKSNDASLLPPKFSGQSNVHFWLSIFEDFAEDKNWDDAKRASKVKLLLRGEAQVCVWDMPDADKKSYEKIKALLLQQYGGSANQHRAMQEFQGRQRKNGESIRELSFALRLLYMEPARMTHQRSVIGSAGIREALLKESDSDTCTLGTLVERATRLEQVMSKNTPASSSMVSVVDDRLSRLEQQLETLTAAVTSGAARGGRAGPGDRRQAQRTSGCYQCGKDGHIARRCPTKGAHKQGRCFNCSGWGHNAATAHSVFVRALLQEKPVCFLLDTGAQTSLISHSLMRSCGLQLESGSSCCPTSVDGSRLQCLGTARGTVQVGETTRLDHVFNVVEGISVDLILGMDFIGRATSELRININNKTVFFNDEAVPFFTNSSKIQMVTGTLVARIECNINVPAGKLVWLRVKSKDEQGVFEPNAEFTQETGLLASRVLALSADQRIPVLMCNLGSEAVTLYANKAVGEFEAADVLEPVGNVKEKLKNWDVNPELTELERDKLMTILKANDDLFSTHEFDLGSTSRDALLQSVFKALTEGREHLSNSGQQKVEEFLGDDGIEIGPHGALLPHTNSGASDTLEYVEDVQKRLLQSRRLVHQKLQSAQTERNERYNKDVRFQPYNQGDLVMLSCKTVKPGRSKSLSNRWTGPYVVLKRLGEVNYRVRLAPGLAVRRRRKLVVHHDRLKPFVKRRGSLQLTDEQQPAPATSTSPEQLGVPDAWAQLSGGNDDDDGDTEAAIDPVVPPALRRSVAWTRVDIGLVEASFFVGYALFSVPGGLLASRLSAPGRLLGAAVLATCSLNLLVPAAAHLEPAGLAFAAASLVRAAQGAAEGCLYPCVHALWRYWAPAMERSRLVTISFFGMALGPIVGLPLSGAMTDRLGWPANFYAYGVAGCLWAAVWLSLVPGQPAWDRYIGDAELRYILATSAQSRVGSAAPSTMGRLPIRSILTSLPVWGIVLANIGRNWTFQFSTIGLPAYYAKVFNLDSEAVGLHLMAPFALMAALTPVGGILADSLRSRLLSTTSTRKLLNTVGFGTMACCMALIGLSRSPYLSTSLLTIGFGFTGLGMSGYGVNHLDIAPLLAGFLMGLSNGIGTVSGIAAGIAFGWGFFRRDFEVWYGRSYVPAYSAGEHNGNSFGLREFQSVVIGPGFSFADKDLHQIPERAGRWPCHNCSDVVSIPDFKDAVRSRVAQKSVHDQVPERRGEDSALGSTLTDSGGGSLPKKLGSDRTVRDHVHDPPYEGSVSFAVLKGPLKCFKDDVVEGANNVKKKSQGVTVTQYRPFNLLDYRMQGAARMVMTAFNELVVTLCSDANLMYCCRLLSSAVILNKCSSLMIGAAALLECLVFRCRLPAGVLSPILASRVTRRGTVEEWRTVFLVAACVHAVTVACYYCMASGDPQPWSDPSETVRLIESSATSAPTAAVKPFRDSDDTDETEDTKDNQRKPFKRRNGTRRVKFWATG
uniref:CCHC-type domain-containing protein n=1 Tax=Macrostomum lignano TaxID=282301 RepID=A0A1I8JKR8_9PLAT